MRKLITLLFILFYSSISFAQVFTGSIDDDWSKAGNWFPATVPGVGASVTINAGSSCRVYAASTIVINEIALMGGTLTVDGILIVDGALGDAIPVQGDVIVNGILGAVNTTDNGVHIYPSGQVTVNFIGNLASNMTFDQHGILNEGVLRNNGTITISSSTLNGLENRGTLSNGGAINIAGTGSVGLINKQSLTSTGQINTSMTGSYGLQLAAGSAAFFNGGDISIEDANGAGILCDADFTNIAGRSITIDGTSGIGGMTISATATIINNGELTISNSSKHGIRSAGNFTNAGSVRVINSALNGIDNLATATFFNNASIALRTMLIGVFNTGVFINTSDAFLDIDDASNQGIIHAATTSFDNSGQIQLLNLGGNGVEMAASGSFGNSGLLVLQGGITYSGTGFFLNTGMLKGTGNIKGSHFLNVGDIAPGNSPGVLTISETYDHSAANYLAEIDPGVGNDLLILPGAISALDGVLTMTTTSTPASGTAYTIISSPVTDISGMSFAIETLPAGWSVIYNAHSVDVMYLDPAPVELITFTGQKDQQGILLECKGAKTNSTKTLPSPKY